MTDNTVPDLVPAMTGAEVECLRARLAGATTYVEFGSGGSTLLAVQLPIRRIWSVESDVEWLARLRRHPALVEAEASGRLTLVHANIGRTGPLGRPEPSRLETLWPWYRAKWSRYYEAVWSLPGTTEADFFLIDGRFRVACGLAVARLCRPDALVGIHDFGNRRKYHGLLKIFDKVEEVEQLAILRRKTDIDEDHLAKLMATHRYNPA